MPLPKIELALAGAFLALQVLVVALFPQNDMTLSYPFMIAAPLLATLVMLRRCLLDGFALYKGWILVAASMLLWTLGMAMSAASELVLDRHNLTPGAIMLVYIQYGVPITYAASGANEERQSKIVRAVDAAMAVSLGYLFYVYVFSLTTLQGAADADHARQVVWMFDLENLFLAFCCVLRYLAAKGHRESRLFGLLAIYTVAYLFAAVYFNHVLALQAPQVGGYRTLWVIEMPFLLLAALGWRCVIPPVLHSPRLARIVHSGSPLMLALAVLLTSLFLLRQHFYLGVAGVVVALVGYGLRSTLMQARHIASEDALRHDRAALESLAWEDALTGTLNRRGFDHALQREYARAQRTGQPLGLLMIDIDYFKLVNDRYGHLVGDRCLRELAGELRKLCQRSTDLLARYGGEEFALLLPDTDLAGATAMAVKVRETIRGMAIVNADSPFGIVTTSVGLAVYPMSGDQVATDLVARADEALYEAKRSGRDRIAYAPPLEPARDAPA
ncbi:GGDEF domain-containing protein [Dyella koreensis]|uniref:diguanylate cyclase n=1 Tax=Dyella koreensis TaxID=311235 RepID=A0ABW8K8U4_9GAMM